MENIVPVERDADIVVLGGADLPRPGDARAYRQIHSRRLPVALKFFACDGARPDETHIASDDIKELRQLIEAQGSQDTAYFGNAGIILQFLSSSPFISCYSRGEGFGEFGITKHGAELEAIELFAMQTNPAVSIDCRAFDEKRQQDKQPRENDYQQERCNDINTALHLTPKNLGAIKNTITTAPMMETKIGRTNSKISDIRNLEVERLILNGGTVLSPRPLCKQANPRPRTGMASLQRGSPVN